MKGAFVKRYADYPGPMTAALMNEMFEELMNEWPPLYWGLEGIADDGWFWFKRRRDVMGANIEYVPYWGA